uniref:3-mercaptopyruvate sulfurtransferase n=1 Tax=Magallana gigas TaxID=29159 RepID=K1R6X2_MAGGI
MHYEILIVFIEHIPGAHFFNIMDDNHTDMYPRNLPSGENFQSRARAIGINNDSHLVLYSKSQHGGLFVSGRAWWTFSGGYNEWKRKIYSVEHLPLNS